MDLDTNSFAKSTEERYMSFWAKLRAFLAKLYRVLVQEIILYVVKEAIKCFVGSVPFFDIIFYLAYEGVKRIATFIKDTFGRLWKYIGGSRVIDSNGKEYIIYDDGAIVDYDGRIVAYSV
jgi:hypothetical protein